MRNCVDNYPTLQGKHDRISLIRRPLTPSYGSAAHGNTVGENNSGLMWIFYFSPVAYARRHLSVLALTELLGAPVAILPAPADGCASLRSLPRRPCPHLAPDCQDQAGDACARQSVASINGGVRRCPPPGGLDRLYGPDGLLLLKRDLLDQQMIDVHGRKVVRVNDVDLHRIRSPVTRVLKVSPSTSAPGARFAGCSKGSFRSRPAPSLSQIPPRVIPWDFVDLIETDPARRVKLKIAHEGLAKLHPADIADIVEDLAPDEREAVFETLDEEVAAGALEEIDPKSRSPSSNRSTTTAPPTSSRRWSRTRPPTCSASCPKNNSRNPPGNGRRGARRWSRSLLEFNEDTAAGRMTTEFIALPVNSTAARCYRGAAPLRGQGRNRRTIFLTDRTDPGRRGSPGEARSWPRPPRRCWRLTQEPLISCHAGASEQEVAELFDKYNLMTLSVVDDQKKLTGVITRR